MHFGNTEGKKVLENRLKLTPVMMNKYRKGYLWKKKVQISIECKLLSVNFKLGLSAFFFTCTHAECCTLLPAGISLNNRYFLCWPGSWKPPTVLRAISEFSYNFLFLSRVHQGNVEQRALLAQSVYQVVLDLRVLQAPQGRRVLPYVITESHKPITAQTFHSRMLFFPTLVFTYQTYPHNAFCIYLLLLHLQLSK